MRLHSDVDGVINALTHLNVLSPSKERNDTLAYIYANDNQHLQALNIIGIEKLIQILTSYHTGKSGFFKSFEPTKKGVRAI